MASQEVKSPTSQVATKYLERAREHQAIVEARSNRVILRALKEGTVQPGGTRCGMSPAEFEERVPAATSP